MAHRFGYSIGCSAPVLLFLAAQVLGCGSTSDNRAGGGGSSGSGTAMGGAVSPGAGGNSVGGGAAGVPVQQGGATNVTGGDSNAGGSIGASGHGNSSSGGAAAGSGGASAGTGGSAVSDPVVWPHDMSRANSDDWLALNHDRITQLRPKVLVVDLENTSNAEKLITDHINALKIAS